MSYTRFKEGESDVYVYADMHGGFTCCACFWSDEWQEMRNYNVSKRSDMIEHLLGHIAAKDLVPAKVFHRLREELRDKGEFNDPFKDVFGEISLGGDSG